jgi:hypothetical protein
MILDQPTQFSPYEKIAESLSAWLAGRRRGGVPRGEPVLVDRHGEDPRGELLPGHQRGSGPVRQAQGVPLRGRGLVRPSGALLDRLRPLVLRLHAEVLAGDRRVALVYVYGELLGGGYPHPDVPDVPGVSPVQTGCWYAPGIELCAVDVAILFDGARERVYLDQADAARLCGGAGLMFAPPLLCGTYEEAFAFPLGFATTLPALLGLPSLGPRNKAEGVVLKPARAIVVPRRPGSIRPVIKRKIPEFSEDDRFHGAEKWSQPLAPTAEVPALDLLRAEVSALVNENRLAAAVSKVGAVRPGDAAQLAEVLSLVREDLEDELRRRCRTALGALSTSEAYELSRFVEGEARALVELHLGAPPP